MAQTLQTLNGGKKMGYDIYWKNQLDNQKYEGCVKNADIITVEIDPIHNRLNVVYRQGLQLHCMYCTSFRCTESGTPEFIPMRSTKKPKLTKLIFNDKCDQC